MARNEERGMVHEGKYAVVLLGERDCRDSMENGCMVHWELRWLGSSKGVCD